MPTNQLPQDIIIKILLFLPVVSIQACKLVSKQWNNLITGDPRLEYPSFGPFLFQDSVYCVSTKITNPVELSSRCNPPSLWVNGIRIEWKDDNERVFTQLLLSESSKGIACVVTTHRRVLFYNLFTGDSYPPTELPDPKARLLFGFGYDSYADDCKMMSVKEGNSLFWVYSLRNRAWKSFEGFPTYWSYWDEPRSCSFNGVLHWLVVDRRDHQKAPPKTRILTYDFHTCRFGEMLLPGSDCCYGYGAKVAELGGRLCYCFCSYTVHIYHLTVWTMREYGVSESWTRFLSIDLTKLISSPNIELSRVLYKCRSGRKLVLFVCKHYGTLYWYDIDNDKVTRIHKNIWEKRMDISKALDTQELEGTFYFGLFSKFC